MRGGALKVSLSVHVTHTDNGLPAYRIKNIFNYYQSHSGCRLRGSLHMQSRTWYTKFRPGDSLSILSEGVVGLYSRVGRFLGGRL
jgi:hypothetical protein